MKAYVLNIAERCENMTTISLRMVNSNPRIPFVTQDSPFVNESPVL